jgi:release factor glutamine methyltransferase
MSSFDSTGDPLGPDWTTGPATAAGAELWSWLQQARQQSKAAGIDPAEADWLLLAVSDLDRLALRLGDFRGRRAIALNCSLAELNRRWQLRLQQRLPVQYLAGAVPWRQLQLRVSPAVLIPRPETELLIEKVLLAIQQSPQAEQLRRGIWADLGTGSGAIAIALAQALPQAQIYAVDISPAALAVAQENAQLNGLAERIMFCCGSWFAPLAAVQGQLAGMVSNPPYIPTHLVATLAPEVQCEPALALDGGSDGLAALRQLAIAAPVYLQVGGLWLVEIMAGQAEAVRALLAQQGAYGAIATSPDLAGIERFVQAVRVADPDQPKPVARPNIGV